MSSAMKRQKQFVQRRKKSIKNRLSRKNGEQHVTEEMILSIDERSTTEKLKAMLPATGVKQASSFLRQTSKSDVVKTIAQVEAQDPSLSVPWMSSESSGRVSLHEELKGFAEYVKPTDLELQCRDIFLKDIEEVIKCIYPCAELRLFGSHRWGVSTFLSDLDVSIFSAGDAQPSTNAGVISSGSNNTIEEQDDDHDDYISDSSSKSSTGSIQWVTCTRRNDDFLEEESANLDKYTARKRTRRDDISCELDFNVKQNECIRDQDSLKNIASTLNVKNVLVREADVVEGKLISDRDKKRSKSAVVEVLRRVYALMRTLAWVDSIEFRHKARIPIICVNHKNGISCDISVGEESKETEIFFENLPDKDTFYSLSSFLKAYLHIYDLDKPFTGGIGSFKLYIMIASIFEDCKKITKGSPLDLGFLLSAFFRVFGNPKNFNKNTVLNHGGLEVDFAGNFQASLCTMIFDHSYKAILKELKLTSECPNSVLSRIIHCKTLQCFRDKSLRLCNLFPIHSSEEKENIGDGILSRLQIKLGAFSLKTLTLQDIKRNNLALYIRLRAYPTDSLEKLNALSLISKSNVRSIDASNIKYSKKRKRKDGLENPLNDVLDSKRWKAHDHSMNKVKLSRKERKKRKKIETQNVTHVANFSPRYLKKSEKIRARAEKRKKDKKMRTKTRNVVDL